MYRNIVTALIVAALIVVSAVAYAATGTNIFRTAAHCIFVRSQLDLNLNDAHVETRRLSDCEPYNPPLATLGLRQIVYKWNGSQWLICQQNPSDGSLYQASNTTGLSTSVSSGGFTCGSGTYGQNAAGYVWEGAWNGGAAWSGIVIK